jgi:hypothetical protein
MIPSHTSNPNEQVCKLSEQVCFVPNHINTAFQR